jgi:hypothetical protein
MQSSKTSLTAIQISILRERLRQARQSFNVALAGAVVCGLSGALGVGFIICGKTTAGTLLTTGGMIPISTCVQLARDSNERLDELFEEAQDKEDKIE